MKIIKRFRFFIISLIGLSVLYYLNKNLGLIAIKETGKSFKEMLLIMPPVFVFLGLIDAWVPRGVMVKYLGHGSGFKGILISLFLGSMTAGPLYGAFPVIAVLMKKGARIFNMIIILGAWSTTKIPMLLFEFFTLGPRFALTRLIIDIPGVVIIAFVISKLVKLKEEEKIVENLHLIDN